MSKHHNNIANEIVKNLEAKGESKDFIIGFLTATLEGLRHLEDEKISQYLKQTLNQTQRQA
jgi:hypothetical protein